jgi:FkbM family methyltransferase
VRGAAARLPTTGTIRHGVGAGLRFDATGGYPGYLLGTSEPAEQAFLAAHLRPGDVFYDLGANIGFYATIAARIVGPRGHVYAFEPHPESAAAVERNARLNDLRNVTPVAAAVSDRDGRLTLSLAESSATHRLGDGAGVEVDVVALDSWRERSGARPPALVMIDVEGAELDVLEGMRDILRHSRPVVCCEVHWLGRAFPDYVERELAPLGYTLTELSGGPPPEGGGRWHAALIPPPS